MKETNIGLVVEDYRPHTVTKQPWRHVQEIAMKFNTWNHKATVITDCPRNWQTERNWGTFVSEVPLKCVPKHRLILDRTSLLRVLTLERIDVVNWHGGELSGLYFEALKKVGARIVWTVHTGRIEPIDLVRFGLRNSPELKRFWKQVAYNFIPRRMMRGWAENVNHIIALSNRIREDLVSAGISDSRISVIPSGVDLSIFKPSESSLVEKIRTELGFTRNQTVVLYCGPLSRLRGVHTLLKAIDILSQRFPDIRCLVVCRRTTDDVYDPDLLEQLRTHRYVKTLFENMNEYQIANLIGAADIVVQPFEFWPFIDCPLTILEAMAVGKPIISTRIGGIAELIRNGETGLIVQPGSADRLASAITILLTNNKLSESISINAMKYVRRNHDWNLICKKYLEIFAKN